jgi:hypothetical protein
LTPAAKNSMPTPGDTAPRDDARRYGSAVGRNVLVVSTVQHAEDVLRAHIGEADTVKVVAPVVRQGVLDWLANDQKAYAEAEQAAADTADELPGETAATGAVDADVRVAIEDALATFPADEIIVVVRPGRTEGPVESAATDTAPRHEIAGVPVRRLVIDG